MKLWYGFAKGAADGDRTQKNLLGGKGANLAEMCNLDIPVPPGFTLPTSLCLRYQQEGGLSPEVLAAIDAGVAFIEGHLGQRLGDPHRPLLLSVRSGARVSMPGMMDTVLNIGLTREGIEGLGRRAHTMRFALDSYRRLIQMYGDVVAHVPRAELEAPLQAAKQRVGARFDHELPEDAQRQLIDTLLQVYERHVGEPFPDDPRQQLINAVAAVFGSWNTKRAVAYRAIHGIPNDWGTAANVQAMVFGNFGESSATGVAFTRNPSTGEKRVLGEWLPNAQGEDVVAGIRTPGPLHEHDASSSNPGAAEVGSLEAAMPEVYASLMGVMQRLEDHFVDMQDVEFTVQDGELFILQTRSGKRTAAAALKVAVDMQREGLIDVPTAIQRVTPEQIDQLLHPQLDPAANKTLLGQGLPASPGAASGVIVIDPDEAQARGAVGEDVILVREETSPEDIHGMHAARGILTATGGMTSHAAVVARGMGRPCVAGCAALEVDEAAEQIRIRTPGGAVVTLRVGDTITLDGAQGHVYQGEVPTVKADISGDLGTFMGWVDAARTMGIRANADTPQDAEAAVKLGAEGIGLCRTEHMFFAPERVAAVRRMILATDDAAREAALAELEPMQRQDFEGIFRAMGPRPVTIRLLDPPLHEFLPPEHLTDEELAPIAQGVGISVAELRRTRASLAEFNPMLGHRGCRLGITAPSVYAMQVRAILEAACQCASEGIDVHPEIMIPLVLGGEELKILRGQIETIAEEVFAAKGVRVPLAIGTMIELPRAALLADEVAVHADFFSFGTNDLTQTTMGLSRDDSGKFLNRYVSLEILPTDPFASLDQRGVGKLVSMGTRLGRQVKPSLKVGVCGEHGGDPASIQFFAQEGLDYVSCSPFRLPAARVALAHAALRTSAGGTSR